MVPFKSLSNTKTITNKAGIYRHLYTLTCRTGNTISKLTDAVVR